MRESKKPLKPWEAIPAPPVSQKPAVPPKPALKKPAKIPVDRSNVSASPPEYTSAQIDRIKEGIKAGRVAMAKRGNYAMVFTDAFCQAGGFQVPGFPQISDAHLRVLGSIVMMWLEGPDYSGLFGTWCV